MRANVVVFALVAFVGAAAAPAQNPTEQVFGRVTDPSAAETSVLTSARDCSYGPHGRALIVTANGDTDAVALLTVRLGDRF